MVRNDFEILKDHILNMNPYFNAAFDLCVKDSTDSMIYYEVGDKRKSVFPDDTLGNYFFMLMDGNFKFSSRQSDRMNDCGGKVYNDEVVIQLIAIVRDAEPFVLLNNLRNSISKFKGMSVTESGAIIDREEVVYQVMRGMEDNEVLRALTRIKDETIISLNLNVSKVFTPNGCIENVCKSC